MRGANGARGPGGGASPGRRHALPRPAPGRRAPGGLPARGGAERGGGAGERPDGASAPHTGTGPARPGCRREPRTPAPALPHRGVGESPAPGGSGTEGTHTRGHRALSPLHSQRTLRRARLGKHPFAYSGRRPSLGGSGNARLGSPRPAGVAVGPSRSRRGRSDPARGVGAGGGAGSAALPCRGSAAKPPRECPRF